MTTLITPRILVTMEQDGSEDYLEYEVQTDNRDAVRWDLLRTRKGWPSGKDAPMLWLTVLAWSALTRSKIIDLNVDKFTEVCVQVRSANKEGAPTSLAEVEQADPSQPVVGTGS